MSLEIWVLLAVCVYGAAQAALTGPVEPVRQIHRNFSETFYLFALSVLVLLVLNGFGEWSRRGVLVYAVGRGLYVLTSLPPLKPVRRWAWAISVVGLVGCIAEVARAAFAALT